jgi:hypothetical protein
MGGDTSADETTYPGMLLSSLLDYWFWDGLETRETYHILLSSIKYNM